MKKKGILAFPALGPSGMPPAGECEAIAAEADIKGERHLLADLFTDGRWVFRWAITAKGYAWYMPETGEWKENSNDWLGSRAGEKPIWAYMSEQVHASGETWGIVRGWAGAARGEGKTLWTLYMR